MIEELIKAHTISKRAHEELMAMAHLDEDIANIFKYHEMEMTDKIVILLKKNQIEVRNAKEKIHIIMAIIDNFCHEIVYHKHKEINYDIMLQEVIKIIISILSFH